VIRLNDVVLTRRLQNDQSLDLKRSLFNALRGRYKRPERTAVLRGINLSVKPGERIGIIGPNGAGKSTLLKVIAGILQPSSGTVRVEGIVAPLIELGAGFDPDLSAIENVVLYGVLLGFDYKQMQERAGAILAFANLADHSRSLVKTLSSGMSARLAFAVASDLKPDILLLDEVFAVGDEAFRRRSRERIEGLWATGTTSMIVSHDLGFVAETCTRSLCISGGRIAFAGEPKAASRFYLDTVRE
jgi:ABC-type polysaccharide/polyol phosphate transport system ATPase subunit